MEFASYALDGLCFFFFFLLNLCKVSTGKTIQNHILHFNADVMRSDRDQHTPYALHRSSCRSLLVLGRAEVRQA